MSVAQSLELALVERGALESGHFRLSSGRHSDRFVQKFRLLEDPRLVELAAAPIAGAFGPAAPTLVVSAAVGGIILGYEVARQLGTKAIFVEKTGGVPALRRNFQLRRNDRVVIVEDVVTTGGSVREVVDVVRQRGAEILGVGIIVRRGDVDFDLPTTALLDIPMESFAPQQCPLCAVGVPLIDPGSRRS